MWTFVFFQLPNYQALWCYCCPTAGPHVCKTKIFYNKICTCTYLFAPYTARPYIKCTDHLKADCIIFHYPLKQQQQNNSSCLFYYSTVNVKMHLNWWIQFCVHCKSETLLFMSSIFRASPEICQVLFIMCLLMTVDFPVDRVTTVLVWCIAL